MAGQPLSEAQFNEALDSQRGDRPKPEPADVQVAGQPISLYRLYTVVDANGGFAKVNDGRKWKRIAIALDLGGNTSAGAALKELYGTHLAEFAPPPSSSSTTIKAEDRGFAVPSAPNQPPPPPHVTKPLYLPFRRDVIAENGGFETSLLEGNYTARAKRIQKEEFGKCSVDLGKIAMHIKSGQTVDITYGLNVLSAISAESDIPLSHAAELLTVLYNLWRTELSLLRGVAAATGNGSSLDYDTNLAQSLDRLYFFGDRRTLDPTDQHVRAAQRVLAITDFFRNLSFYGENQKHLAQDSDFLNLFFDTMTLECAEPHGAASKQTGNWRRGGPVDMSFILELRKSVVVVLSTIATYLKLSSPFVAGRITRFLFGFLTDDFTSGETAYSFPALEAFAKVFVIFENREVLAWNSDLLGLDAWIPKLSNFLLAIVGDFAFSTQRLAILELVLMGMYNLCSLNDELRRTLALQPGTIPNLFTIALAGQPASTGYLNANAAWTMVRAKAAQVLRELARGEDSQHILRTYESSLIAFLMEQRAISSSEERAAFEELVIAFHGILFSLQVGPG